MKIFDIHVHIYPDKIAEKASQSIGIFYDGFPIRGNGSLADCISRMDDAGVDMFCAHSVAMNPHNVESINRFILQAHARYPDRIVPFAALHPDVQDVPALVDDLVEQGFRGVKIHPDIQRFVVDDPRSLEMLSALAGRLPVLIHCGDTRYDFDGPERILNLHRQLPDLTIIGAHFGGWSQWESANELLSGHEGILVDCSSSLYTLEKETAAKMIRRMGAENVLFGSDYPMWTPGGELEKLLSLPLTPAEQEDILWNNAARLFNL